MLRSALACLFVLSSATCGGSVGGGGDGGKDAAPDLGPKDDAGYTACSTPEGYRVCGRKTACPSGVLGCTQCLYDPPEDVSVCTETFAAISARSCWEGCNDGDVCVMPTLVLGYLCYPYSLATLHARYFSDPASRIRYADYGKWTGALLPEPTSCPTFTEFRICGANCGGCQAGEICTGRSPLHPHGICMSKGGDTCARGGTGNRACKAGTACLLYTVEPEAQAMADEHGHCFPTTACQALADKLPGGGTCLVQQ